jgi:hypothetical protein
MQSILFSGKGLPNMCHIPEEIMQNYSKFGISIPIPKVWHLLGRADQRYVRYKGRLMSIFLNAIYISGTWWNTDVHVPLQHAYSLFGTKKNMKIKKFHLKFVTLLQKYFCIMTQLSYILPLLSKLPNIHHFSPFKQYNLKLLFCYIYWTSQTPIQ